MSTKNETVAVKEEYTSLFSVFQSALGQAQSGKGAERHTIPGQLTYYEDQQICVIPKMQGSVDGLIYQVIKKCLEIKNITGTHRQVQELLGAINYIAAAIIVLEDDEEKEPGSTPEKS